MSNKPFATGKCLCGKVTYTISSEPLRMGQCHCEDCRRSTGTGHASNAFFAEDSVKIEGDTSRFDIITDTGSTLTRYFCPNCGSRLFSSNSTAPNFIGVTAGTVDDSSWFKANFIVYNKSKPEWDCMDSDIPTFEEMPPTPPPTK
ncbi:MAG TPA: GFA family protein [Leucothrix mucor]|nr:GFA family protein [Leucothrix mucor]